MNRKNTLTALLFLIITTVQSQPIWQKLSSFNDANAAVWMTSGNNYSYIITSDRWVYYTDGNATSWEPFINVPTYLNIGSIRASLTTNRVFCLTSSSGIAYTDNLGQTWQTTSVGTPNGQSGMSPLVLAYGIHNTKIIASTIGSFTGQINNDLFLSTNNGGTFTQIGNINFYPTNFHFISDNQVVSNSSTGIFKTDNVNASTWTSIGFEGLVVTDLEVNDDVMYASVTESSGHGNVYKTEDGGLNWTLLSGILDNNGVPKLAMDWQNNRLFAATTSGVLAYINNEWVTVSGNNKAHEIIITPNNSVLFCGVRVHGVHKISSTSLAVEQVNQGLILPADYMVVTEDKQIYTASNKTAFLSKFNLDQPGWETYDLFENLETTNILGLEKSPEGQCVIAGMHYIAETENQGQNINIIASAETAPLAPVYNILFPQKMSVGNNGSISMIQHQIQTHVDYSPNMADSWEVLFETVSGVSPGFLSIDKALAGTQTNYIFGLSNTTAQSLLIASSDNGVTWNVIPNPTQQLRNIFVDKEDTLYGITTSSIYKWDVANQEWVTININIGQSSTNKEVELMFDNQNRLHVLVRTTLTPFTEEGIYLPNDNQDGFTHVPFPTINGAVVPMKKLSFAGDNIPIMMSSLESNDSELTGFYYYSNKSLLSTDTIIEKPELILYPNPVSDVVYISGLENQTLKAVMYSITGQRIDIDIQNGKMAIQNFPSGIYILNFEYEGNSYQFKIIVKK